MWLLQEEIAKLLRFETSSRVPGEMINLSDYVLGMPKDSNTIYYFAAPTWVLVAVFRAGRVTHI